MLGMIDIYTAIQRDICLINIQYYLHPLILSGQLQNNVAVNTGQYSLTSLSPLILNPLDTCWCRKCNGHVNIYYWLRIVGFDEFR